jgi:glycosyltransferase involved in cell wall biosynthesis
MTRYDRQTRPCITIGLPVYNGERYLAAALESILAQTIQNFELVISDNASTDSTQQICKTYAAGDSRIRYYRQDENLGAAHNFNFVFSQARGKYFKWAAHDDLLAPTYLERCLIILEEDPGVVLVYPRTIDMDATGREFGYYSEGLDLQSHVPHKRFRKFMATPGFSYPIFGLQRSDVLRSTPGMGNFPMADRNLIGEMSLYGRITEIPEYLFYRRHHPETSTNLYKTEIGLARWYDPKANHRAVFFKANRFVEYLKSINRVSMPLSERVFCYAILSRYLFAPERWFRFGKDLLSSNA